MAPLNAITVSSVTFSTSQHLKRSSYSWITYVVFLTVFKCTVSQFMYRNCEPSSGTFAACFPSPEDVFTLNSSIITVDPADATCGQNGDSFYMLLGDRGNNLLTCSRDQHNKNLMVDNTPSTWWQSNTWTVAQYTNTQPNPEFPITLTFSLNKTYRLGSNITLTFNSGRPFRMIIEKSADYGQTWQSLQYYARDCTTDFPNVARSFAGNITAVICTEVYSQDTNNDQPGRKVHFPGPSERMKGFTSTQYYTELEKPDLKQFLTFTDVRVHLLYPATDIKEMSRRTVDFYRYYYAISDISVNGSCFCNLHGSGCISNLNKESVCECSHNTEGKDCERCKPLYNNRPWQEGSFLPTLQGTANACEKCECNDHADSCTYNATRGFGVCDNCKHNTSGLRCEQCLDTFYPNTSTSLNDPDVCLACDCELLGLLDITDLVCQKDRLQSNVGQCECKSLVTGRRCDRCIDNYYGLLLPENPGTCKACGCNQYGTTSQSMVCDPVNGQCPCKISTDGRTCGQCKQGYYRLPPTPFDECLTCGCDAGGSTNPVCDVFGICTCISHVTSPKCNQVEPLFYIPALDEFVKQPIGGDCTIDGDLWTDSKPFDGDVFATCRPSTTTSTLEFESLTGTNQQMALSWPYFVSIRYSLSELIAWADSRIDITVTGNTGVDVSSYAVNGQPPSQDCPSAPDTLTNIDVNFTNGISVAVTGITPVTLDKRCNYTVRLKIPAKNSSFPLLIDSVVFLPALSNPDTGAQFRTLSESSNNAANYPICIGQLASLSTRSNAMSVSPCRELLWSVAAELYKEGKACQCNPVGTTSDMCDGNGGQCPCEVGVGGRRCDVCLPGYYNLTAAGCTPCGCQDSGSVNGACNPVTGQCKCRTNVALNGEVDTSNSTSDRQCSACRDGYYGYGSGGGCTDCACNPEGSNGTQCAPDGQCPCKPTIGGRLCDRCADSYFNFAATGCQSCDCDPRGTLSGTCNLGSGQCECKSNVEGNRCDTCKPGFFNLASYNPRGCQPCFCFNHGTTCTSADNFMTATISTISTVSWVVVSGYREATAEYLGDRSSSYGRMLNFEYSMSGLEGNISQQAMVVLEGEGSQLVYRHMAPTLVGRNVITVRLFPENWNLNGTNSPSPSEMYRILANMTRLAFQTVFGGLVRTVSSVSMETAIPAENVTSQTGASFVEQCSCTPSDLVAGLSCEKCLTGNRRRDLQVADLRYGTCMPCSCSGRTEGPIECDELTGVCLNCRNGTTGDNCGSCAANVMGQNCDVCIAGSWGLDANGCKDCNCSAVGSTPSTTCNRDSGQCVCVSQVTGRQCDVCVDNYYNLTTQGCQECDGCYKLVMDEANKLRELITNLTSIIATLRANDDTARLGRFVDRINNATASLNQLLEFLKTTTGEEASVQSLINGYNTSVTTLSALLDELSALQVPAIEQHLQQTNNNLQDATNTRQETTNNMKSAYSALDPLRQISTTLNSLVTSLRSVETYLLSVTSNSTDQVQRIMSNVIQIENRARQALNQSQTDQETSQRLFEKHKDTTQKIAQLENIDLTLETLSTNALTEARRIGTKSNDSYYAAISLKAEGDRIGILSPNFLPTNQSLQFSRQILNSVKTTAENGKREVDSKKTVVDDAISKSEQQRLNTNNIVTRYESKNARLTAAERQSEDARLLADKVFNDAVRMRDIMRNFESIANEIETQANISLGNANTITAESQNVIDAAATLMSSLTTSQRSSADALDKARQAKTVAAAQNEALAPVATAAEDLERNVTSDLTDLQQISRQPSTINTTTVIPARDECLSLQSDIVSTNAFVTSVDSRAETAKTTAQQVQNEAARVLNEISNLPNLDTAKIAQLRDEVAALPGLFNEQELRAAIASVTNDYNQQKAKLDQLKAQKANLQRQIENIKTAQQRISYTNV